MMPERIAELRALAEAADGVNVALARRKFDATFDPATVLALLDEVAGLGRLHACALAGHDCSTCPDCIHHGRRCCGCYDGACCREGET